MVRVVNEIGRPVAYVVWELGVSEGALGNWVCRGAVERVGGLTADERAELACLRCRVVELEVECGVLKRSVVVWVNEAMW